MQAPFKRNQRVRYVGTLALLAGKTGTFRRMTRNGWCSVDFDDCGLASVAPFNLAAEA
ncbi:hypothetical protein [Novosphingobium sp. KN65.2]|uniref:hypothetical protein n=1 Tax=Novosphingobium sp. KN65.2 TaxID=1478134 RepID=UPI0005E777FA|nr:hypothetical protein [Novosphingobium sp. KN65.2]CDO34016.1 hypothetical protein SPHV1_100050 [Novosphingobium sp. KN65.2]